MENETIQTVLNIISSVGFPIVVAWYLLTTLKKTIEENTKSNQALGTLIEKICVKLNIEK